MTALVLLQNAFCVILKNFALVLSGTFFVASESSSTQMGSPSIQTSSRSKSSPTQDYSFAHRHSRTGRPWRPSTPGMRTMASSPFARSLNGGGSPYPDACKNTTSARICSDLLGFARTYEISLSFVDSIQSSSATTLSTDNRSAKSVTEDTRVALRRIPPSNWKTTVRFWVSTVVQCSYFSLSSEVP